MTTRNEALRAVRTLLEYIGEDPDREGLRRTPERVIAAWETDWARGYLDTSLALSDFDNTELPHDQMVFVGNIAFVSHCEHHLAPFYGCAHLAYLPKDRIVGLSKLVRIVELFARRLQVQERMTTQIAEFMQQHISPDVAVSLSAVHMCMISRGVRQPHSKAVTTALRGCFREERAQDEFLRKCMDK